MVRVEEHSFSQYPGCHVRIQVVCKGWGGAPLQQIDDLK
jgi:hypothetical protein